MLARTVAPTPRRSLSCRPEQSGEPLIRFGVVVGVQNEFLPNIDGPEEASPSVFPPSPPIIVMAKRRLVGKRIHPRAHTPNGAALPRFGQLQRRMILPEHASSWKVGA
jgi:hypothetical protein